MCEVVNWPWDTVTALHVFESDSVRTSVCVHTAWTYSALINRIEGGNTTGTAHRTWTATPACATSLWVRSVNFGETFIFLKVESDRRIHFWKTVISSENDSPNTHKNFGGSEIFKGSKLRQRTHHRSNFLGGQKVSSQKLECLRFHPKHESSEITTFRDFSPFNKFTKRSFWKINFNRRKWWNIKKYRRKCCFFAFTERTLYEV